MLAFVCRFAHIHNPRHGYSRFIYMQILNVFNFYSTPCVQDLRFCFVRGFKGQFWCRSLLWTHPSTNLSMFSGFPRVQAASRLRLRHHPFHRGAGHDGALAMTESSMPVFLAAFRQFVSLRSPFSLVILSSSRPLVCQSFLLLFRSVGCNWEFVWLV